MKPSSAMALASRMSGHCACTALGVNAHIEPVRATTNSLARILKLRLLCRGAHAKVVPNDYARKALAVYAKTAVCSFLLRNRTLISILLILFAKSALGQKRKSDPAILTSVLSSTTDIRQRRGHVRKPAQKATLASSD